MYVYNNKIMSQGRDNPVKQYQNRFWNYLQSFLHQVQINPLEILQWCLLILDQTHKSIASLVDTNSDKWFAFKLP